MRHLIITAHPSSKGFTHKIAKTFLHESHENNAEAEILDLYNPRYSLDFLKFENIKNIKYDKIVDEIQDKIRLADNIVFVYPMWWYSFPGIFKNFIDKVFTNGFAFKNVKGNPIPVGLLKGKTCQVFTTCDGPWIYYAFVGRPGKNIIKLLCSFCGIKLKSYDILYSKSNRTENKLNSFLKMVERKV
ncbi:MAG: NAD(P)H-dependent oxidoreductase [Nanoarchaeales archaeon]|nr:NAD(P)H-dependent oxidoreductase [Nanoarchaeales archaeon]